MLINIKNKQPSEIRVLVAMSGGVDSSITAALLKAEGYDVIGVTLQLYTSGAGSKKTCCADVNALDAKRVANHIKIPHYTINCEETFKKEVVDVFLDSYINGKTPVPCINCNRTVKFRDLMRLSQDIKADAMATGHYARRIEDANGNIELHTGIDSNKDQSYFLFATTKEQMKTLYFPLGDKTKHESRMLAQKFGLIVHDKPDSQDLCFIAKNGTRDLMENLRPDYSNSGDIVHIKTNKKLGHHDGLAYYTIGQRRGLGIASAKPLYVVKIDIENAILWVGEEEFLYNKSLIIDDTNMLVDKIEDIDDIRICIRALQPTIPGMIEQISDTQYLVTLADGGRAITPGQACVIYQNTRVLGGGIVVKTT